MKYSNQFVAIQVDEMNELLKKNVSHIRYFGANVEI